MFVVALTGVYIDTLTDVECLVRVFLLQAGSLNKLVSLDSLSFEPKSVFLFLHTPSHGPHLHTVHVWVGTEVSHFALQSAYQHTMRLVQHVPGRPLITKEVSTPLYIYIYTMYTFYIHYHLFCLTQYTFLYFCLLSLNTLSFSSKAMSQLVFCLL